MSWQATAAVWKLDMAGDTTAKVVLLALAFRLMPGEDTTWPSVARIAADTEYCRSTVRGALQRLGEAGHVEVIHSPGRSSRYRLTVQFADRVPADGAPADGAHRASRWRAPRQQMARQLEENSEENLNRSPTAPPQQPQRAAAAPLAPGRPAAAPVDIHRPQTHPVALGHLEPLADPTPAKADFATVHLALARRQLGTPRGLDDAGEEPSQAGVIQLRGVGGGGDA